MTDERDERDDGEPVTEAAGEQPVAAVSEGAGAGDELASATGIDRDDPPVIAGEIEEYRAHLQRLQAEFDNYRKRVLREQTTAVEMAAEPVMRRLLEVLDDFELALLHAGEDIDRGRLLKGVELVYAKLVDTLRAEGLERIEAEGQPFDPAKHEALMQTGDGDGDPRVAEVFRPGYALRGRVLRPAGVRVERE